ncbi:MAG TPA: hypothetical protein VHO25_22240 [Polyangiaceae bacterium]|nr:hypothetical protein [Polyangiaceae bacterium]
MMRINLLLAISLTGCGVEKISTLREAACKEEVGAACGLIPCCDGLVCIDEHDGRAVCASPCTEQSECEAGYYCGETTHEALHVCRVGSCGDKVLDDCSESMCCPGLECVANRQGDAFCVETCDRDTDCGDGGVCTTTTDDKLNFCKPPTEAP